MILCCVISTELKVGGDGSQAKVRMEMMAAMTGREETSATLEAPAGAGPAADPAGMVVVAASTVVGPAVDPVAAGRAAALVVVPTAAGQVGTEEALAAAPAAARPGAASAGAETGTAAAGKALTAKGLGLATDARDHLFPAFYPPLIGPVIRRMKLQLCFGIREHRLEARVISLCLLCINWNRIVTVSRGHLFPASWSRLTAAAIKRMKLRL
jgi:hypothetical protein